MSGKLMGMVMAVTGLNSTCKLVLMAYAYHAKEKDPRAWPGQELLEKETGLDERTIRKWVAWLKNEQLLIPAGYKFHTPAYRINIALLASLETIKEESGADLDNDEPAPGAALPEGEPAPGAGLENKPAPGAALPEGKPESSAGKPAPGANKPESSAAKPAPESPKPGRTGKEPGKNLEEEEESPAAAAPVNGIITAQRAERIFTEVTGMVSVPGGLEERELVLSAICNLANQQGPTITTFLRPFYQAQIHTDNRQGRPYQKTSHFWLTEWAVGNELPDYVMRQLRSKFKTLPAELVDWMLQQDRAKAGITPPSAGSNGKPATAGTFSADTIAGAEELGLVKPRKGQAK